MHYQHTNLLMLKLFSDILHMGTTNMYIIQLTLQIQITIHDFHDIECEARSNNLLFLLRIYKQVIDMLVTVIPGGLLLIGTLNDMGDYEMGIKYDPLYTRRLQRKAKVYVQIVCQIIYSCQVFMRYLFNLQANTAYVQLFKDINLPTFIQQQWNNTCQVVKSVGVTGCVCVCFFCLFVCLLF